MIILNQKQARHLVAIAVSLFVVFGLMSLKVQAQTMPYVDDQFDCVTAEIAQKYTRDFHVDVASFGGQELCDGHSEYKKLINDFYLIQNGQFDQGDNLFIRGFVSTNYYDWMKSQTYGIERGNDVPYAVAYNSGGYFTMQDGWAKASTLGRVGTVIHEARHTAGYMHIPCRQGTYQGSSVQACDRDYNYGGSHAVEMEYYARVVVQGKNFHPVYKKMARLMALARSNFLFNTPVLQKKETLLVLNDQKNKTYVLQDKNWLVRETPQLAGQLKRTSFGAVMFNLVQALVIDPYQDSGFSDVVADTYSYFKLILEKGEKLFDFEEYDQGSFRYVTKITSQLSIANYNFPQGQWGKELSLPFKVARTTTAVPQVASTGLFLIKPTGEIAQYLPAQLKLVELPQVKWNFDFSKVVVVDDKKVILQNGDLAIWNAPEGQLTKDWDALPEPISDVVSIPVYNAFQIRKSAVE